MSKILFVGERRSPTAKRMKVTWKDGRLAAKQLFDAFAAIDFNPDQAVFVNFFEPGGPTLIGTAAKLGVPIVAMGRKVQEALKSADIDYFAMVHPAARGKIRRKDLYTEHVRSVLQQVRG